MKIALQSFYSTLRPFLLAASPRNVGKVSISPLREDDGRAFFRRGALLLAWACVAFIIFQYRSSQLFIGFDGGYIRNLIARQMEWHVPLTTLALDFYQGLGDVFFPTKMTILPENHVIQALAATPFAKAAGYSILFTEFTLVVILFARQVGLSFLEAMTASMLTTLLMFPFFEAGLLYNTITLSPQIVTTICLTYLVIVSYLPIGRGALWLDALLGVTIIVLFVWMFSAVALQAMLAVPFLGLGVVSGLIAATSFHERRQKIVTVVVIATFLLATGPIGFLAGMIFDSAPAVFNTELANSRASFFYASILFHWETFGPVPPIFMTCGVIGAVYALWSRNRILRAFAITMLTYLGTRLMFATLTVIFDFWRGPSPIYFEFLVMPLYATFASFLIFRIIFALADSRKLKLPSSGTMEKGALAVFCVAVVLMAPSRQDAYGFSYPPKPSAITDVLSREIGLRPGQEFRGRVASIDYLSMNRPVGWIDLHIGDAKVSNAIGNEHRVTGLHYFGIPTLMQYGSTITPTFYALVSRLLSLPQDAQMRAVLVMRRVEPRILAMLGVKFIITDEPTELSLRGTVVVDPSLNLYLYQIANPNLGNYSPTQPEVMSDATSMLVRMKSRDFDPQKQFIVSAWNYSQPLNPADSVTMIFEGTSLRVTAISKARSVIILPVAYSRCLTLDALAGEKPLMVRANLVETAVVFSGPIDIRLAIANGPFVNPLCRLNDRLETNALNLGAVPFHLP
jgi:hypothetical protein